MREFILSRFRHCQRLLAILALLPGIVSAATEIHLAPAGNDTNPGTAALPVKTPQGAQVRVRTLIQAGLTDSVEVIFAAGTYVMATPLELRPEDSGTAAFPITWKAASGAEVILSGGQRITSTWTNGGGGIWFTDLSGIGLAANQWNFRQLFVDGSRATRARFPNVTAANPFLYATGGNFDHVIINPALVKSSWGTAADAQINVVPQSRFFNQWNTVTAVNTSSGRIDIADSERHRLIDSGSWFWIEGVQAELDEPREWFLNPTTGRLSYIPPAGVDPNTQTIIAPFLNRIINVKGDINAGTHVEHVNFDGLKFLHTSFTLGHIEARVHTDTAIMFENTNHSSVKNCYFENIGGYALWLHLDSQRNSFDHNTVQYSGGGGVLLTGSRFAYMDDSKIYTPGAAAAKVAPILNEITHNTVEHCGKIRYYGGGVHLDSRPFSMTMAPGNYIAHNLFNDLSRNGFFAFRNQGGNVVEYNHIHNAMQTTIDGGCIHFATMNTVNAPNFILNNWLYDVWGYNQQPSGTPTRRLAKGIFLDWDTSTTTINDNWIYNVVPGEAPIKVIFGGNRNIAQSGNQTSATVITPPFVAEVGPGGTATNGINLATNKLTGSIVSYQDTPYFSKTGTWTEETAIGIVRLFEFKFLTATAAVPSQATYTLPITEDGNYQISLLYKPGSDRASNVPVAIDHADGISNITWNMKTGSTYGFAVPVGTYRFVASETNTVRLSSTGANGKVIADSVAFVKIETNEAPVATNVQVTGSAALGGTLTGSYTYGDANGDSQGASIFRWYRSDDAVLDAGDTIVAGAVEVTPVAVKTSTSLNSLRRANNLFNAAGMSAMSTEFLNLDGSQPGEPSSADGISWLTPSGSESGLLTDRKAWFVVDLGASYPLSGLRIWNFQWALSGGDLSNRGIKQFDCLVRDTAADTLDGTPGGTPINPDTLASATAFALGSSNPWQPALLDQSLTQAPSTDTYTGQAFPLAGQTGRFLAIVADSYYSGNGIGLGKMRVETGGGALTYTPVAADVGKNLIFQVTPVATTGVQIGSPREVVFGEAPASGFVDKIRQGIPQRVVLYGTSLTLTGAWVPQLIDTVEQAYPDMVTWVNSGGSGKASDWGVTNLQTKVIDQNPDTVFIEFSMNDAATTLNISRVQALANLTTMVNTIKSAHPDCEIILQIMNPVDRRETDTYSPRPDLALYQQDYRNFAVTNGLQCMDHMPAFMALLDEGSTAYRGFVPDGVHPSADGFARYLTPVLLQAIGLPARSMINPGLVIDNSDPAPAMVFNGTWTTSATTPGYIGADYRHNGNAGQGSKSAVFTPNIPTAGTYPIYLRWTSESNRATNVPVTVNYNGGSQNFTVDQTKNSGTWVSLGSFPFAAGSSASVTIGTTAANGFVIVDALGVGLDPQNQLPPTVRVRMDNARAAEPALPGGPARASSLIVWRSGPTQAALTVPLDFTGGTSLSGSDYMLLPTSITIPAGKSSAGVDLLPLHDLLIEGDETFKASLLPAAGYTTDYPNKASIVIEDRTSGGANVAPVASDVSITGTTAIGGTLQGNYSYSDAEGDAQGASTFRWLRSDDGTLDSGDTSVGSAASYVVQVVDSGKRLFFEVTPRAATGTLTGSAAASVGILIPNMPTITITPISWKQSNSFSTARAASNLSNAAGMNPAETLLYNQDVTGGVNPSETTGADDKYWVTTSGGNEGAAAAAGKVWIVADLGATYHLTTFKIWNFNWDNTAGTPESLNNRGVSQFDFLVRDSQADTSTGFIGGAAINLNNPVDGNIDDDAVFNLGTSDPWATAISNQALAVAVNNDSHAATSFDLTGQTARFVAIRVDSYYGENGIGLGKVRFEGSLAGGNTYAAWLADSGPATGFITDSDNDGLPNGVEHLLGSNPNTYNAGLTEVSSTPISVTFKHTLNPTLANDITYGYQWSTDLVNWYASGSTNSGGTRATITPSSPDVNRVVTVVITITIGTATQLFGRLVSSVE